MSTVLPLADLLTEMPTDGSPFVRVTAVCGAGATLTSAMSPSVTDGPPVKEAVVEPAAALAESPWPRASRSGMTSVLEGGDRLGAAP